MWILMELADQLGTLRLGQRAARKIAEPALEFRRKFP
jgi:hypothetical protein